LPGDLVFISQTPADILTTDTERTSGSRTQSRPVSAVNINRGSPSGKGQKGAKACSRSDSLQLYPRSTPAVLTRSQWQEEPDRGGDDYHCEKIRREQAPDSRDERGRDRTFNRSPLQSEVHRSLQHTSSLRSLSGNRIQTASSCFIHRPNSFGDPDTSHATSSRWEVSRH
jgi:hypothetical protein